MVKLEKNHVKLDTCEQQQQLACEACLASLCEALLLCNEAGAEPFFSKLFSIECFSKEFGKVWKKSLEKVWKKKLETGANSEGTCFFGHDMSDAFRALFPRGRLHCRYDHVAVYDDDNIKKSKLARQPTRSSAGPVCYSPVPAQGRLRRRLQTQRGTRMASARRGESTTDDAMAVEMDRQASGHRDSSDNDGEAAA